MLIVPDFRPKAIVSGIAANRRGWRVPCHSPRMAPFHRRADRAPRTLLLAFLLFLVATPSIANAADPSWDGLRGHIRTTDDRLRRLLDLGMRSSPTFRALVHRLLESDVVV
jgi:hypothetical protein